MGESTIATPDQRVRVFVSSTLGELAAEREAVRGAVERLRLSPVMFELGARPHPPRELYRAYLAQSHVFIGIYWQRYGWVAPGEVVSGLEDEYDLAGDRPRLLYLKHPAPEREERLDALIARFQDDDRASYRRFSTTDELAALVEDDLALLLSERFAAGAGEAVPSPSTAPPVPLTRTVGRDDEIGSVTRLLRDGERLVTVTGPGGIGKTRVALEAARALAGSVPGGVHFVPLAAIEDPALVLRVVADRLGARVEGTLPVVDSLADHLGTGSVLLVLDNLEQVIDAAGEIAALLGLAPGLQVLATSRQVLRVPGERVVPLEPLALPDVGSSPVEAMAEPSVRLFVERAGEADPSFTVTPADVDAVVGLSRHLEGLPLAIELAAARVRLLPPAQLLDRLRTHPTTLGSPGAGAPERQRTIRATLDWSYRLLTPDEARLFARLGAFVGGFTLEAAAAVCADGVEGAEGVDVLEGLASLLDKSLLVTGELTDDGGPRLAMLEAIRTYAAELLEASSEVDEVRKRHLGHFRRLADVAQPFLCGPGQREWVLRIDPERANLRVAVATALEREDDEAVIELVWDVYVFYWIRDAVDEPESWMAAVVVAGRPLGPVLRAKLDCLQTLTRISRGDYTDARDRLDGALAVFRAHDMAFEAAVALKELANVAFVVDQDAGAAVDALCESSTLFDGVGHDWGVALVETMLGTVLAVDGDLEGAERHHRLAIDRARAIDNEPIIVQSLHQLALVRVLEERYGDALALLQEAAPIAARGGYRTAATYCLDVLAAAALGNGDPRTALRSLTVSSRVRERLDTPVWPTVRGFVEELERRVEAALGPSERQAVVAGVGEEPFEVLEEGILALTGREAPPGP
jgi:predicted ATPase